MGYSTFSLGFELGVQSAWVRVYGVPGFESMGYIVSRVPEYIEGMGYIVSHYS